MRSTVTKYLGKARESAEICTPDTRSRRIEVRQQQLETARIDLASVLPIEGSGGREVIEQRVSLLEQAVKDPTFEERYPDIEGEVLQGRNRQKFPRLALFSIDSPTFSICGDYIAYRTGGEPSWQKRGTVSKLPRPLQNLYTDVFAMFQDECQTEVDARNKLGSHLSSWSKHISCEFQGLIPQSTREKIQRALPDFSITTQCVEMVKTRWYRKAQPVTKTTTATNIFLIGEVTKWQVDKKSQIQTDPLVVGYKAGGLWLIDSFDETPLEEYVRREFRG